MHKAFWILDHDKNKDFRWQHVEADPFKNWEQWRSPDMKAEVEFDMALRCLYADQQELGRQYLRRAIAVAERALKEDKCRSERCKGGWPWNEGRLKRTLAYARALGGERFDTTLVVQASERLSEWCAGTAKRDWDEMDQLVLLAAIRLALLAGDAERARTLLRTKRSLKANAEEKELLQGLAEVRPPSERAPLAKPFKAFFDKVRDPGYKPPADEYLMHRLELGALYDKSFVSVDGEIDWNRVIEAVSE